MIADCTGKTVIVPGGSEFGARGAALLAGVALGWYPSIAGAVQATAAAERRYTPDPAKTTAYDRLYRVYNLLQHDLRPAWQAAAGRRGEP